MPVYIRFHHSLTSGNGEPELKWSSTKVFTVDANGKPVYDFTIMDQMFDSLKQAGGRPMERLATASTGEVLIDEIRKSSITGSPDVDALATQDGKQAAVLVWNYEDNDVPARGSSVEVRVNGIPADIGRVLLQHYRIDDSPSNAYTVWKGMGSPQKPSAEQFVELQAAGQLQDSPVWLDVHDGAISVPVTVPRQSVSLPHLSW